LRDVLRRLLPPSWTPSVAIDAVIAAAPKKPLDLPADFMADLLQRCGRYCVFHLCSVLTGLICSCSESSPMRNDAR
jgi:hypothetical protein